MSYRWLQRSPQDSTRVIRMRITAHNAWSTPAGPSPDIRFLRSWFEVDSNSEMESDPQDGVNWGAISGMALAIVVSASFWAGLAFVLTEVLR